MVRTRRHQLREVAASDEAEAVKVAARAHQKLVWERTRHALRMRSALREYFPAALAAYAPLTLTGPDTLELLAKAPDPAAASKLTITQISAGAQARPSAGRGRQGAADPGRAARAAPGPAEIVTEAYAASVTASAAVITVLNEQIKKMEATVESLFRRHPDAGTYLSQPGIGVITGARMLGEFGDAPGRYADARARRNYAGTSPLTIASGKKKTVHARFIHNDHRVNAMHNQAFAAISASPGARAYYDELRSREIDHTDALRRVANRLAGILHGCVKTGTAYDEHAAWGHRSQLAAA